MNRQKKLWQDTGKWTHDKYDEYEQAPKSNEELVAAYGFDLRAAERLPEATRRKQQR